MIRKIKQTFVMVMGGQYQPIDKVTFYKIDYNLNIQEALDPPRVFALDNN